MLHPVGHRPLGEQGRPAPADVFEHGGRAHDVQVRVLLTGERCGGQVFRRGAGSDGVGGVGTQPGHRRGDGRRQIIGDRDRRNGIAELGADRADRLPVVRAHTREAVEPFVDRRRIGHDPAEGVRRHAEAGRYPDARHPGELAEVRPLAADDADVVPAQPVEPDHVAAHPSTCPPRPLRSASSPPSIVPAVEPEGTCIVTTAWALAASPPPGSTLGPGG